MNVALRTAVRAALVAVGEHECDTYTSNKITGRRRYRPDYPGFRLYSTFDVPAFTTWTSPHGDPRPWYLGVGHAGHLRKVLRRYAAILTAAGFTVHVCATHRRTTVRAYIDAEWTYGEEPSVTEHVATLSVEDSDTASVR